MDRLSVFRCNLELGKRAFEYNAPRMYNSLPPEVKHSKNMQLFKKRLKTQIFARCYDLVDEVINNEFKL